MPGMELNEFTDWESTERSCSCWCLQFPRDPLTPFAAHPCLEENGRWQGSRHRGSPRHLASPSTHMQSSKHLLFRPRLWGVQRCSRRSQQVPAHMASTRGQPCRADPPHRPIHAPTGQEIHHLRGGAAPGRVDHLVHKAPRRNHRRMSRPRSPEGGRLRP